MMLSLSSRMTKEMEPVKEEPLSEEQIHEELMAHLEQKKREVAAIAEAAEVAHQQAMALLHLQKRTVELEKMAAGISEEEIKEAERQEDELLMPIRKGPVGSAPYWNNMSAADRKRYGLEDKHLPLPPAVLTLGPEPPEWSSLSVEDRLRFGLDGSESGSASSYTWAMPSSPVQAGSEALWETSSKKPVMANTIAQLEAVGATHHLAALEESEKQLQYLNRHRNLF